MTIFLIFIFYFSLKLDDRKHNKYILYLLIIKIQFIWLFSLYLCNIIWNYHFVYYYLSTFPSKLKIFRVFLKISYGERPLLLIKLKGLLSKMENHKIFGMFFLIYQVKLIMEILEMLLMINIIDMRKILK